MQHLSVFLEYLHSDSNAIDSIMPYYLISDSPTSVRDRLSLPSPRFRLLTPSIELDSLDSDLHISKQHLCSEQ